MNLVLHTEEKGGSLPENAISGNFLQAELWATLLKQEGKQVEWLSVSDGQEVVARALVEYRSLPFGWQYAFCPGGPVFVKNLESRILNLELWELFFSYFRKKKCLFFRFEPLLPFHIPYSIFHIQKAKDINPSTTTLIDVSKTNAELLGAMHHKTRYNIRLAEKKGVQIGERKDLAEFMRLSRLTGGRDGFKLHDEAHYKAVLNAESVTQLSAQYEGKVIATMVLIGAGDTLTYLYGASDHAFRSVQAPALLQWRAIQLAKERGYSWYDFFGIAPDLESGIKKQELRGESGEYRYDPKHQYAGVTRFKLGFGGKIQEKPGTYDLILSPRKYRMYELLRKIRRWSS